MRNWLGQDILPGAVVYRGARRGNSSEYKLGVVEYLGDNGSARVHYKYESGYAYKSSPKQYIHGIPKEINSKGNPAVDSLILMDDNVLARMDQTMFWIKKWQDDPLMTQADLRGVLDTLI
jgi:hypothetical protein